MLKTLIMAISLWLSAFTGYCDESEKADFAQEEAAIKTRFPHLAVLFNDNLDLEKLEENLSQYPELQLTTQEDKEDSRSTTHEFHHNKGAAHHTFTFSTAGIDMEKELVDELYYTTRAEQHKFWEALPESIKTAWTKSVLFFPNAIYPFISLKTKIIEEAVNAELEKFENSSFSPAWEWRVQVVTSLRNEGMIGTYFNIKKEIIFKRELIFGADKSYRITLPGYRSCMGVEIKSKTSEHSQSISYNYASDSPLGPPNEVGLKMIALEKIMLDKIQQVEKSTLLPAYSKKLLCKRYKAKLEKKLKALVEAL